MLADDTEQMCPPPLPFGKELPRVFKSKKLPEPSDRSGRALKAAEGLKALLLSAKPIMNISKAKSRKVQRPPKTASGKMTPHVASCRRSSYRNTISQDVKTWALALTLA